jgi:hypothetical protein
MTDEKMKQYGIPMYPSQRKAMRQMARARGFRSVSAYMRSLLAQDAARLDIDWPGNGQWGGDRYGAERKGQGDES